MRAARASPLAATGGRWCGGSGRGGGTLQRPRTVQLLLLLPDSHVCTTLPLRLSPPALCADIDAALAADLSFDAEFERFRAAAAAGNLIPLYERVMADQLTPVLAYRCLVKSDDREAPSFLLESVTNGTQQGRYSFVGAHPAVEVIAKGQEVQVSAAAPRWRAARGRGGACRAGRVPPAPRQQTPRISCPPCDVCPPLSPHHPPTRPPTPHPPTHDKHSDHGSQARLAADQHCGRSHAGALCCALTPKAWGVGGVAGRSAGRGDESVWCRGGCRGGLRTHAPCRGQTGDPFQSPARAGANRLWRPLEACGVRGPAARLHRWVGRLLRLRHRAVRLHRCAALEGGRWACVRACGAVLAPATTTPPRFGRPPPPHPHPPSPTHPPTHAHPPTPSPLCSPGKLPFEEAPQDDRDLPDMHLALYNDVVVFDHATKLAYVIACGGWSHARAEDTAG